MGRPIWGPVQKTFGAPIFNVKYVYLSTNTYTYIILLYLITVGYWRNELCQVY